MHTNNSTDEEVGKATVSQHVQGKSVRSLGSLIILLVGIFIGRYVVPFSSSSPPVTIESLQSSDRQFVFPTFWETWDELHERFIGSLDDKDLFYGAVAGMVNATEDPYTVFSDPDEAKQFEETLSGSFSGVGIEIGIQNGIVTVIAPIKGSPADVAGVREGDAIVAVDQQFVTQDMSLDEVVQKIRGPIGEKVTLTVVHKGESKTEEVTIIRETIVITSVIQDEKDGIAHIQITSFNEDTTDQFAKVANDVRSEKVRGIILDLRGNPGGFLQSSVDIASYFLDEGTLVVTERGKEEEPYKTRGGALLRGIPLVVLVDGGSASASEILAGALADHLKVQVIGEKTFGKGSVQELIPLNDGSSLRVTVAKWYTPNGRSIDDEGIEPTIAVEDNMETEGDEQLDRAYQELGTLISG